MSQSQTRELPKLLPKKNIGQYELLLEHKQTITLDPSQASSPMISLDLDISALQAKGYRVSSLRLELLG